MIKNIICVLGLMTIVVGCSTAKEQSQQDVSAESHHHESTQTTQDMSADPHHKEGSEHHHESSLQIDLQEPKEIKVNEKTDLSANIQKEQSPLIGATVRFEIWKADEQVHIYVDATEKEDGVYNTSKTFSELGTYQVKVHVEKEQEQIHDHWETKLEVK